MLRRKDSSIGFVCLAWLAGLSIAVLCAFCFYAVFVSRGVPSELGWDFDCRADTCVVSDIIQPGPAYGKLKLGDLILRVANDPNAAHFGPPPDLATARKPYSINVRRDGAELHFQLEPEPDQDSSWLLYFVLAFINFGLAVWIGIARPDSGAARVAFFLFLAITQTYASAVTVRFFPAVSGISLGFLLFFTGHNWRVWPLVYDFALRFPEPIVQPRFLRILRVILYSLAASVFISGALPDLAQIFNLNSRSALFPSWISLGQIDIWRPVVDRIVSVFSLVLTPLVLVRNYRMLSADADRRKLRWVALGVILAFVPMTLERMVVFVLPMFGGTEDTARHLDVVVSFATVLLPITVTYAIVKHRVLGIRVVIRRGVQYLLAQNVLRFILYLPFIGIAIDIALHPTEPLQDFLVHKSWWVYLTFAAGVWLSLHYRRPLRVWVDKKFFRSAYEEEVILSDLIEELEACETVDDVARQVAIQIQAALEPSHICVLFRHESTGGFSTGYPSDLLSRDQFRPILDARLENLLHTQKSACTAAELASNHPDHFTESIVGLERALITPIHRGNDELMGVILLGERKSETAYSKRDRMLLQAMAKQIALVIEVLGLKERVREEGRVRVEVLGRLDQEQIQLVLECPACGRCYSSPATHCESDGNALSLTLPIERVIEGKYRLERRIGTGGMGAVYEARDLRLDRRVAVKVMTGRLFGNNVALKRFEREARAIARLQHINIVSIYDFGPLRGDGAFLVMQLLAGRSWRTELLRSEPIAPGRSAIWFDQLCDAVAYAHLIGIVHRDLKPENVLVSGEDKITVVDFGLAKLQTRESTDEAFQTTEDAVLGTYGYMSPEQRAGLRVDRRTDIYSIAVMVVETLTKVRPPQFGASREWAAQILRTYSPAVTRLASLIDDCLKDSASERLADVRELQHQLIPLLRSHSTGALSQATS